MVKIPYDKANEEKLRDWAWKYEHRKGKYPSNALPLEDWGEDISDHNKWELEENEKIDIELSIDKLPPQQRRVAEFVLAGYSLIEIAEIMRLNYRTIKRYFSTIKKKVSPFDEI